PEVAAVRAAAQEQCDCQTATRHGRYVRCIARFASDAVRRRVLRPQCATALLRCAKNSMCGRASVVACCRTDAAGIGCNLRRRGTCKGSKGEAACAANVTTCCDVCASVKCQPVSTTTTTAPPGPVAHYEYVFPDGSFTVYDMDDAHRIVKTVPLPQA